MSEHIKGKISDHPVGDLMNMAAIELAKLALDMARALPVGVTEHQDDQAKSTAAIATALLFKATRGVNDSQDLDFFGRLVRGESIITAGRKH